MGSGKTTIGKKLAENLGYYFIDSDQEIEDREGKSVAEIFESSGEKYFRNLEKDIIKEVGSRGEEMVLSLGGGAFMNEETRDFLKGRANIIWLYADIDVILHRVGNKTNRPLLNNKNKREILEDLAKDRYKIYGEADFKFDTGFEGHESLVKKIIKEIN